LKEDFTKPA
jgi:hypothetical protein